MKFEEVVKGVWKFIVIAEDIGLKATGQMNSRNGA